MRPPEREQSVRNKDWFELREVRKRGFSSSAWIPLKMSQVITDKGKSGHEGYEHEYVGVKTIAFPVGLKAKALELGWQDMGFGSGNSGWADEGSYVTAETFSRGGYPEELVGLHLLLVQEGDASTESLWHLNQDLVLTLGLWREGDSWIRPEEGYAEVARLKRDEDGRPCLLEIRAEHLRDYLCARQMGLYVASYRGRVLVTEQAPPFSWQDGEAEEQAEGLRWFGKITEIHEGGMRFGEKAAVFHAVRTDVEPDEDVPVLGLPTDDNIEMSSWTKGFSGRKLHRTMGDLWKEEWIDPADASPIVRRDDIDPTAFFIVDAAGKTESRKTLSDTGRWLWFRSEAIAPMANRRGGSLKWYTRDTGTVSIIPGYDVTFGINKLGLVTVYAKDVALLPDWQQRIWAGYNVAPDGGIAEELYASQVKAAPAETLAPETYLGEGLSLLNAASSKSLGFDVLSGHDSVSEILRKTHRFRSCDQDGFFALAKDLARLTVDLFNHAGLKQSLALKKDDKL